VRYYLPLTAAHVLRHAPALAGKAVQALCERDATSMKACRAMAMFPPTPGVMVMLPLPRLRYAQLSHDKFRAPKCFPILPQESHPDYSALENGAKLACGLEMLYSEGKPGRGAGASTQADVKSDKNWAAFEQALSSRGFFRGELKGSKEYRRLEEEAQQHFVEGGMGAQEAPAVREQIDALLSMPFSEKDFPASELSADDNESWMEVTPEHLEAMLASRAASGSPGMPTGEE